jgi:transcriptional antiterminator NusG
MVTGFLGSSGGGAKPVPLTNEEILPILKSCGMTLEVEAEFNVGDKIRVLIGTFEGLETTIEKVNLETREVTILVDFFGRQTPQEISFDDIKKIEE